MKKMTASQSFKLPRVPVPKPNNQTSRQTEPSTRRRMSPTVDNNPYPQKNRKVLRSEDSLAELDELEWNKEDSRKVYLTEPSTSSNKGTTKKPFPRSTNTLGFIAIKSPTDVEETNPRKVLLHEELMKVRQKSLVQHHRNRKKHYQQSSLSDNKTLYNIILH